MSGCAARALLDRFPRRLAAVDHRRMPIGRATKGPAMRTLGRSTPTAPTTPRHPRLSAEQGSSLLAVALAALEPHPNAAAVLGAAVGGTPSHAYLLHGPAGSGKRAAARAVAAELLARGAGVPAGARLR